jgi:AcrR family transcriptional regulator
MTERKQRRRLDAETARTLILDATEKRLAAVGPSGIRLQEVAADAGVSHPTVLHHFGSRELLVKAVIERSLRAINASLIEALQASSGDEQQLEALLENVGNVLEQSGHARVVMWLALEGHRVGEGDAMNLGDVVGAAHAIRLSRREKGPMPTREDTARTVVLATLALIGGAVVGPMLLKNAGLGEGADESTRFRHWLARFLIEHLDGGKEAKTR